MTAVFGTGSFEWILGIEDTCIYPEDGSEPLDEHELTDHTKNLEADIKSVADFGATSVRYGMSWPLVHTAPGTFNWEVLDEALDRFHTSGVKVIADLVHYGTPTWLRDGFCDPRYPDAIAEFAGALIDRYGDKIAAITPLNEPITTASFCGLRGVWPPYRTGWTGWVEVVVPMALGMVKTIEAVRSRSKSTQIVHVEASTNIKSSSAEFDDQARLLTEIGWLPTDMILGRVDESHTLYDWLIEHGARKEDLTWLVENATDFDVMGVNYYPDLTPRELVAVDGETVQVAYDRGAKGLGESIQGFAKRYGIPIAITETSIEGDDEKRMNWLEASVREVAQQREAGVDLRGYTWWPLFDFVDWSWAADGKNVEEFDVASDTNPDEIERDVSLGRRADGRTPFLRRMGLVRLVENSDGFLERHPTPVASRFASMAAAGLSDNSPKA